MFRLKELRIESGLKRSDFAKEMNLPASTVANYENEIRQAPYALLIAFAEYFNVSVDYLLGKDDDYLSRYTPQKEQSRALTAAEKELISLFRDCSPLARNRISEYARLMKIARFE